MGAKLTEKQKLFCIEYLKDFNATRSAKAAGYTAKNLEVSGCETLRIPKVQEYLGEKIKKKFKKVDICVEDVLKEIKKLAMNTKVIKHSDKLKALELLGKYFKMFTDNVNVTVPEGLTVNIIRSNNEKD